MLPKSFKIKFISLLAILFIWQGHHRANTSEAPIISKETCFNSYLDCHQSAAKEYMFAYEACQQQENNTLKRSTDNVSENELEAREFVQNETKSICEHFELCNRITDEQKFFNCHTILSPMNLNALLSVQYVSTNAIIALDEHSTFPNKEILPCVTKAQKQYLNATTLAVTLLKKCLLEWRMPENISTIE